MSILSVGMDFNDSKIKMGLYKVTLPAAPGISPTLSLWPVVPEASAETDENRVTSSCLGAVQI